jgi:ABC-type glycerol-3-phosphate transport system substrate-binding protein
MMRKISLTKNYILDQIEQGVIRPGERLPSARRLCEKVSVSFAVVQNTLTSLVNEGILETRPRLGTYLLENFRSGTMTTGLNTFYTKYPWFKTFEKKVREMVPELRLCSSDQECVFEISSTISTQNKQKALMDLGPLFYELYPDDSLFFTSVFKDFSKDGKQFGIPFIFSPRVMYYNPKLLRQAGLPIPTEGWTWSEFMDDVRVLKKTVKAGYVFNLTNNPNIWMNFVFRAGGSLFVPKSETPVQIDSSETRNGLHMYQELHDTLDAKVVEVTDFIKAFTSGEAPFMLAPKEIMTPPIHLSGFEDWDVVPLPRFPNGTEWTTQATDVFSIRESFSNRSMIKYVLKCLFSEEIQDYIGSMGYGIPVRKSSAFKSFKFDDRRDMVFFSEIPKMTAQYGFDSIELYHLVTRKINRIFSNKLDVDEVTAKLAQAVRTLIED